MKCNIPLICDCLYSFLTSISWKLNSKCLNFGLKQHRQVDPYLEGRTTIQTLFLYLRICLSVMLNNLSCSFTSISFLINLLYIMNQLNFVMPTTKVTKVIFDLIDFLCFNATFNNISAISWRPVLMVEEARVPGENHRPWASNW